MIDIVIFSNLRSAYKMHVFNYGMRAHCDGFFTVKGSWYYLNVRDLGDLSLQQLELD